MKRRISLVIFMLLFISFLASCTKTYTISFETNMEGLSLNDAKMEENTVLDLSDSIYQLSSNGYVFKGWFYDETLTLPATYVAISENQTLYASWNKICTVSYDLSGFVIIENTKVEEGKTIEYKEAPVIKNHVFVGWYLDKEFKNEFDFDTPIIDDIVLYGTYFEVAEVLFDTQSVDLIDPMLATVGSTITLPTSMKREGYTFVSWYKGETAVSGEVTITEDTTFTAKWEPIEYTITYVLYDGTNGDNITKYTIETPNTMLIDPVKVGYKFNGWFSDESLTKKVTFITKGSMGDITLYAFWSVEGYSISYNLDGGTNSQSNPKNYTIESNDITLYSPTKAGYKFIGWFIDSAFTSEIKQIVKGTSGNLNLYAKWELE